MRRPATNPYSPFSSFFPFYPLGFRCNPFRVLAPEEIAEVALLPPSVEMALASGGAVQLLGCMGSGKSTLLRGMAAKLEATGLSVAYEFLAEGQNAFHTPLHDPSAPLDCFCLDEAQRLSWWQRWRLLSAAKAGTRLLLATHRDMRPLFEIRRLPLVSVQVDALPHADIYFALALRRRLEYFALPDVPHLTLPDEAIDWLRTRFGADIRSAENMLYMLLQDSLAHNTDAFEAITVPMLAMHADSTS